MQCIQNGSLIFTAEAKAVDLALDFIITCDTNNKLIIFKPCKFKESTDLKTLKKCHEALASKEIIL